MFSRNRFSPGVERELGYYVYRLIDPRNGQTFYVGKGKGNRVFDHARAAIDLSFAAADKEADDAESLKIKQIRGIINDGLQVIHVIQRYGMSENEAFEVEAALIDVFLPTLTNIQSGHASERGVNSAYVIDQNLKRIEFEDRSDISYCMIKIRQETVDERNGDIYEAVRKHWRVNLERAESTDYVLAVIDGVVKEVYGNCKWYASPEIPGRYMFDGETAPEEIKEYFIDKRIPQKYRKKGNASPVLYHDI